MARKTTAQEYGPEFNGLSIAQVRMILEEIATTAGSLIDMCRRAACDAGLTPEATNFHIAQMLSERIGALADQAVDGEIRGGTFTDWAIGGSFREQTIRTGAER